MSLHQLPPACVSYMCVYVSQEKKRRSRTEREKKRTYNTEAEEIPMGKGPRFSPPDAAGASPPWPPSCSKVLLILHCLGCPGSLGLVSFTRYITCFLTCSIVFISYLHFPVALLGFTSLGTLCACCLPGPLTQLGRAEGWGPWRTPPR